MSYAHQSYELHSIISTYFEANTDSIVAEQNKILIVALPISSFLPLLVTFVSVFVVNSCFLRYNDGGLGLR